jgi:type II secretion system protein C
MQVLALKTKFQNFDLSKRTKDLGGLLGLLGDSIIIIFAAYILATILTSVMIPFVAGAPKKRQPSNAAFEHPRIEKSTNYRDFRNAVLARNIFNSEGAVPEEADPTEGVANAFDPKGICQKPTVNVELMGIIATGNAETTLATIQEKGYTIADVYRAGDKIINQEQALIYAIEEDKVILNNNGVKECLELNTVKVLANAAAGSSASKPGVEGAGVVSTDDPAEQCPGSSSTSLEASYVEDALGPGFSKILEAGRLVPYHRENAMVGFKLIGVRGGSLWARANLSSGDVITAVNGQSMAQPEKGFALYEALQADKAIRVEFLKAGKTPCILNVEIK